MKFYFYFFLTLFVSPFSMQADARTAVDVLNEHAHFWLKGDAGVVASGSAVTAWNDQTSNGINFGLTENLGSYNNQVYITHNQFADNSLQAISFDAYWPYEEISSLSNTTESISLKDIEIFVFLSRKTGQNGGENQVLFGLSSGEQFIYSIHAYQNAGVMSLYDTIWGKFPNEIDIDTQVDFNINDFWGAEAFHLLEVRVETGVNQVTILQNGGEIGSYPLNDLILDTTTDFTIGSSPSPAFDSDDAGLSGNIAEVIYFDSVLIESDRELVRSYFENKYEEINRYQLDLVNTIPAAGNITTSLNGYPTVGSGNGVTLNYELNPDYQFVEWLDLSDNSVLGNQATLSFNYVQNDLSLEASAEPFNWSLDVPTGLVGWWRANFDGNNEVTGGAEAQLIDGASVQYDLDANRYAFNLVDDGVADARIVISNQDGALDLGSDSFSIEFWFSADTDATSGPLFSWGDLSNHGLRLRLFNHETYIHRLLELYHDGTLIDSSSTNAVDFQDWNHVALVYDSNTGFFSLYLNGIQLFETAYSGLIDTQYDLNIGYAHGPTVAESFKGSFDDFSIYSSALSETTILEIYGAGNIGKKPSIDNDIPTIDVGADLKFMVATMPVAQSVTLSATATDDGPLDTLTYLWEQIGGPSSAVINDSSLSDSTIDFDAVGVYIFKCSVSDGELLASDTVTVVIGSNQQYDPPSSLIAWWDANYTMTDLVSGLEASNISLEYELSDSGARLVPYESVAINNTKAIDLFGVPEGFTIEGWFDGASDAADLELEWSAVGDPSRSLRMLLKSSYIVVLDSDSQAQYYDDTSALTGKSHVALIGNIEQGNMTVFVNGVELVPSTNSLNLENIGTLGDLTIKGQRWDELSFYAEPLSTGEIQQIYAAGAAGKNAEVIPDFTPFVSIDPTIYFRYPTSTITVEPYIVDHSNDPSGYSFSWSLIEGDATKVSFLNGSESLRDAELSFTELGSYRFQLELTSGGEIYSDEVLVEFLPDIVAEVSSDQVSNWNDVGSVYDLPFALNFSTSDSGAAIYYYIDYERTGFAPDQNSTAVSGPYQVVDASSLSLVLDRSADIYVYGVESGKDDSLITSFSYRVGFASGDGDGVLTYGYTYDISMSNDTSLRLAEAATGTPLTASAWPSEGEIVETHLIDTFGSSAIDSLVLTVFEAILIPQFTEGHDLYAAVNNCEDFEFYIDGVEVEFPTSGSSSVVINMNAGQEYQLKAIAYALTNSNDCIFRWKSPSNIGTDYVDIPKSQLFSGIDPSVLDDDVATALWASSPSASYSEGILLSHDLGKLSPTTEITLTTDSAGGTIYYTINDEDLDTGPIKEYINPITIEGNVTLRAFTVSDGQYDSPPFVGRYTLDDTPPEFATDLQQPSDGILSVSTSAAGVIGVNVKDDESGSGVAEVTFSISKVESGVVQTTYLGSQLAADATANGDWDTYEVPIDILQFANSDAWSIEVEAVDLTGNRSSQVYALEIDIGLPPQPEILAPSATVALGGFSDGRITFSGDKVRSDCSIQLQSQVIDSMTGTAIGDGDYVNVGSAIPASGSGQFSVSALFVDNDLDQKYQVRVLAIGRDGDETASSNTLQFAVDSNYPPAPINLQVEAQAGGVIEITWDHPVNYQKTIANYILESSDDGVTWTVVSDQINTASTSYIDERYKSSDSEDDIIYRIRSINSGGNRTVLADTSSSRSVVADGTSPLIEEFIYEATGADQYDSDHDKYAPGFIDIYIKTSEPLDSIPYLILTGDSGGTSVVVSLIAIDSQRFEGSLQVDESVVSGLYTPYIVLRDLAGNESEVSGPDIPTIDIDSEGPQIDSITNHMVFNNDGGSTLSYFVTFDEATITSVDVTVEAEWGDDSQTPPTATITGSSGETYTLEVTFAALDGYDGANPSGIAEEDQQNINDAVLYLRVTAVDTLGNVGVSEVPGVLIYRDTLPAPAPPLLSVEALPSGKLMLVWTDVDDAVQYQVFGSHINDSETNIFASEGPFADTDEAEYQFITDTLTDGEYSFYVYAERLNPDAGGGVFIQGFLSNDVTIQPDQTLPPAVESLELTDSDTDPVRNSVLKLVWTAPDDLENDIDHYAVYRTEQDPLSISQTDSERVVYAQSGTLIQSTVSATDPALLVYDSSPVNGLVYYTVVTVDAVGNATLSTASASRNITLVPPLSVTIIQFEGEAPTLLWSAVSAADTYNVYYQPADGSARVTLATDLIETGSTGMLTFTDLTWSSGSRTYIVESVTTGETVERDIVFPGNGFDLLADTILYRGLPARIEIERANADASSLWEGYSRRLGVFAGTLASDVDIYNDPDSKYREGGLYADYVTFGLGLETSSSVESIVARLQLKTTGGQDLGESVLYYIERELDVEERLPFVSLAAGEFSRGSIAQDLEITVGNTSENSIQLYASEPTNLSDPSKTALSLKLLDLSGNILAEKDITNADRTVDGEGTYTIDSVTLNVPESAPPSAILQVELNYYEDSVTEQLYDLIADPITSRLSVTTASLSYEPFLTAPLASANAVINSGETLLITGKALKTDGSTRSRASSILIGIENGDYKRTYTLITDASGEFSYSFLPGDSEPGGTYTVWAKHPELTRTPTGADEVATFVYRKIAVSPDYFTVRTPQNYKQSIPITLTLPSGLSLKDVMIEAVSFGGDVLALTEADLDQDGDNAYGVVVTLPEKINSSGSTLERTPSVKGIVVDPAMNEASFYFRVSALVIVDGDEDDARSVIDDVPVYCYFSDAFGQLTGPSKDTSLGVLRTVEDVTIEGVTTDDVTTAVENDVASATFKNTGLIALTDLQFELLELVAEGSGGYQPAPEWAVLSVPSIDSLGIGESITVQVETRFDLTDFDVGDIAQHSYVFDIVARTNEAPLSSAGVTAVVTTDANCTLEVQVLNIFFGYVDSAVAGGTSVSAPAEYLAGVPEATVTLTKDDEVSSTGWTTPTILTGKTSSEMNPLDGADGYGKITFGVDETLPPGRYQIKVTAPKHETYRDTLWIKPGLAYSEPVVLNYGTVTVEWEVKEITIEDRYDVRVETTFETSVPAPVLAITPSTISLPAMCPGDVYDVELLVENKGILAAQDFENPIPASDEYLRVEPITILPDQFDVPAKESIRVAYRYICIKALTNSACDE